MAGMTQYDTKTGTALDMDQDASMLRGAQGIARQADAESFSILEGRVIPRKRPKTNEQMDIQDAKDWQVRMNPDRYEKQKNEGVYDVLSDVISTGSVSKKTAAKYNKTGKSKSDFVMNNDGSVNVTDGDGNTKRISRYQINAMMSYHNKELQRGRKIGREDEVTGKKYARSDAKTKATELKAAQRRDELMPQVYSSVKPYTNGKTTPGYNIVHNKVTGKKWEVESKEHRNKQKAWNAAVAAGNKRDLEGIDADKKALSSMRGNQSDIKTWRAALKDNKAKAASVDKTLAEKGKDKDGKELPSINEIILDGETRKQGDKKWASKFPGAAEMYNMAVQQKKDLLKQQKPFSKNVEYYEKELKGAEGKLDSNISKFRDGSSKRKALTKYVPSGTTPKERVANFREYVQSLPKGTYYLLKNGTTRRRGYPSAKKTVKK